MFTAHRRESFGDKLLKIFKTLIEFVCQYPDVTIVYPSHPNPNVQRAIEKSGIFLEKNICVLPPLCYKDLIYLLINVDWVATDSGGIQEEAVSLGKKVLVLRDFTERWEGIWDGMEMLVGTDEQLIRDGMKTFYNSCKREDKKREKHGSTVYGDGHASRRIINILRNFLFSQKQNFVGKGEYRGMQKKRKITTNFKEGILL